MAEANLKTLYGNLRAANKEFTRSYDEFKSDMQDAGNRERLYKNMPTYFPGFDKSFEEFSSDISVTTAMPQQKTTTPQQPAASQQQTVPQKPPKQEDDVEDVLAMIQQREQSPKNTARPSDVVTQSKREQPKVKLVDDANTSVSDHAQEKPMEVQRFEREEQEKERDERIEKEMHDQFATKKPESQPVNPLLQGDNGVRAAISSQKGSKVPTVGEMREMMNKTRDEYEQEVYDRRYSLNPDGTPKDSFAKDLFDNWQTGVGEIALTPYKFVEMAENFGIDAENYLRGTNFQHGTGTATRFMNKVLGGDYLRARVEHYRKEGDRYQDGKGITETMFDAAPYRGDFGTAVGKAILSTVQSAPNLVVSIYSGKKGLETLGGAFLGSTAALQKYDEIGDRTDISAADKALSVFGAFVSECVPEIIGAKRYGKMFNQQTVGTVRKETQKEVMGAWEKFLNNDFFKSEPIAAGAELAGQTWNSFMKHFGEGATEALTDVMNLAIDIALGIKDGVTKQDVMSIADSFIVGQLSDAIPSGVHAYQQSSYKHSVKKEIENNPTLLYVAKKNNTNPDEMAEIASKRAYQEPLTEKEQKIFDAYVEGISKHDNASSNMAVLLGEAGLEPSDETVAIYTQAIKETGKTTEEVDNLLKKDSKDMTPQEVAYISKLSEKMKELAGGEETTQETPAEQPTQEEADQPVREKLSTGTKPLEFNVTLHHESREAGGKSADVTENVTVSFRSDDYSINDNGAIESGSFTLSVKGKPVYGKRKQELIDAINAKLTTEKTAKDEADAAAREEEERQKSEAYQREHELKQMQEQLNQQKAAVRQSIPMRDGRIDAAKATPEQIVFNAIFANQNGEEVTSPERQQAAVETAKDDILYLQDKKAEVEQKTGIKPSQKKADMAYYDQQIKEYYEAIQKWIGTDATEQLEAALNPVQEAPTADETHAPETPEPETSAEKQRIHEENRRKYAEQMQQKETAEQAPAAEPVQEQQNETPIEAVKEEPAEIQSGSQVVGTTQETPTTEEPVVELEPALGTEEIGNVEDDFEEQEAEPVDLTADDVVLMTSGAGGTRQTFVFARKQVDEDGKETYISLGNPFNKTVPSAGKVLRSNWGEINKDKKLFYVTDADGNPMKCYALTTEDLSSKKFNPGAKLNAVLASTNEPIKAATSMQEAYVLNKEGEKVSILKGGNRKSDKVSVESADSLLDYPIIIRYKSEAKGQNEIIFTLRDLLYSGRYEGDNHIVSRNDETHRIKRAAAHPYAVALEYLREESRKAFGADRAGEYTSDFNMKLKRLFEAWNEYCAKEGLTDISDKLNKLNTQERDLFWSARAAIAGLNLNEADKASLAISTAVDADNMGYYLKGNPLHQLAVMLYIGSKTNPQLIQGADFVKLPGKSGQPGKGRAKNVVHIVTKDVIEAKRKRYKDLKEGNAQYDVNNYTSNQNEIEELEKRYPEVLTDEPAHNRQAIEDEKSAKEVGEREQAAKLHEAAAKEAAKTKEEKDADQEAILQKAIEEGFAAVEKAIADKDEEKRNEYVQQLNLLISGNAEYQKRLSDMLAYEAAKEIEHQVQETEPATEEQPTETETPAEETQEEPTPEEPAAEPITEEVPEPEKRRKKNKAKTPAEQLKDMIAEVNDLKRRMQLGDQAVTPALISEKMDTINDFISENGDTEELWNIYNGNVQFSVSAEQRATTERSRALGDILVRLMSNIKGIKVHLLDSQEAARRIAEELSNPHIEFIKDIKGTILGYAAGNEIYISPEGLEANTPIHEYTHLWVKALRLHDAKTWEKIKAELKEQKALWESVTNDENYKDLEGNDDAIASEVLARYVGEKGEKLLEELAKNQKFGSEKLEKAFINRVKRSLRNFWERVFNMIAKPFGKKYNFKPETLDDFANMTLRDLFDGNELDVEDRRIEEEMAAIKDKAIADNTFLKAPNGKQSNLPEQLWLLVRTENFKKWFGDWEKDPLHASKVVDENGEPLVVYHGTDTAGYDRFRLDKDADARSGSQGFYTNDNRRVAAGYTRESWYELPVDAQEAILGADPHEAIYSLFVNIKNPMVVDFADEDGNKRHWNEYPTGRWVVIANEELGIPDAEFKSEEEANEFLAQFGGDEKPIQVMLSTDDFLRKASELGFDGCIFKNVYDGNYTIGEDMTDYVALEPNQLKSVHNKGYFSAIDDRIEYQYAESELSQLDEPEEELIRKQEDKSAETMLDPDLSDQEREGFWENVVTRIADQSNGMRLMLNSINAYRKMKGLETLDMDKYDVRTKFEACRSIIANKIGFLEIGEQKELDDYIRDFAKTIENSEFYKQYMKEVGGKNPTTLTPVQFIERYLMARNNWERAKEGVPRGLAEFKQRMGMGVIEFSNAFTDAYGEQAVLDLWEKIRKMTDFALDTNFEGGMISEELYNELKAKKFYVPQRGFWDDVNPENEQEDKLERRTRGGVTARNKLDSMHKAEGGTSLAEGCLAYIARDARQAIKLSEENKVKKVMFDLLRANEDWCHEPEHGFKVPRQVFYQTNDEGKIVRMDDGPTEEQRKEMRQLKGIIKQLKEEYKKATTDEERADIEAEIRATEEQFPYFDEKDSYRILHTRAKTNKALVGLYIDGAPCEIEMTPRFIKTADALNGRQDKRLVISGIKTITSWLSAQYTMNNPTFFAVNIVRDTPLILTKGAVEYGPEFSARFTGNFAICNRAIWQYLLTGKVEDKKTGNTWLDEKMAATNAQLLDFLNHGGNTGYSNLEELQRWRNRVADLNPGGKPMSVTEQFKDVDSLDKAVEFAGRVLSPFGKALSVAELKPVAQALNEWSEMISRFSAYKSVVDMGLGVNEGIKAAHNLSTNFNRRGLGGPFINLFNTLSVFANATIQGASGYFRTLDDQGGVGAKAKKVAKTAAVMGMLPALLGFICTMFNPDDDEYEYMVGDYTRDNYVILGDVKFALNEQLKPWWCIGVNAAQLMRGRRTMQQACNSVITSIITNWVPLPQNITAPISMAVENKFGGQQTNAGQIVRQAITPSFMQTLNQWADNKNFMGGKLRYDIGDIPEYQMAPNEAALYQDLAKMVYYWNGGNKLVPSKTKENGELMSKREDINPKEIRANMFWVPSGAMDNFCLLYGLYKDAKEIVKGEHDETNVRVKDIPIVNRFYSPSDNSLYRYAVVREARDIVTRHNNRINNLEKQAVHFSDVYNKTGDEGAKASREEAIRLLTEERKDVVAVKMKKILKKYDRYSIYALQNKLGESRKEVGKYHGESVESLDAAEKKLVQLLLEGVNLKKGLRHSTDVPEWIEWFDNHSIPRQNRREEDNE